MNLIVFDNECHFCCHSCVGRNLLILEVKGIKAQISQQQNTGRVHIDILFKQSSISATKTTTNLLITTSIRI